MRSFVIAAALCATAMGHNWMTVPKSRNNNRASTAMPCPGGSDPMKPTKQVERGVAFPVKWTINHGGPHYIKITGLVNESKLEGMPRSDFFFYKAYSETTDNAMVTVPGDLNPGLYVMQYVWSNYRNCATLKVVNQGEGVSEDGDVITNDPANCVQYCSDFFNLCTSTGAVQYTDKADCLQKCAAFPVGDENDIIGNSLNCRYHHLHVEGGDPKEHCPHGDFGGSNKCIGGEPMVPAIAVTITADGEPDTVDAQIRQAFDAAEPGSTVTVSEDSASGSYVVSVQFASQAAADTFVLNPSTFETVLAMTNLTGTSYAVVGAGLRASESVSANTVAAAVTLPMTLAAVFGLLYWQREAVGGALKERVAVAEETLIQASAGVQGVSAILLMVLMASSSWAVAGPNVLDTTFGLFNYCSLGDCIPMGQFDANAAAIVQAVQAFVILSMLSNLFGAGLAVGLYAGKVEKNNTTTNALSGLTATTAIFVFLGICLYAAYYFDVIKVADPTSSIGWPLDLMGVYWVVSVASFAIAYRLSL